MYSFRVFSGLCFTATLLMSNMGITQTKNNIKRYFDNIEIYIDTLVYSAENNLVSIKKNEQLAFEYKNNNSLVEFRLYPKDELQNHGKVEAVLPSQEFNIIDSIALIDNSYYRVKVRFEDLAQAEFLSLNIALQLKDKRINLPIPLFPYTETYATMYPGEGDFFIGEEKTFEVITNQPENIDIDPRWKKTDQYEYRIYREENKILFSILPSVAGEIEVALNLTTKKPLLTKSNQPFYQLPAQFFKFIVKGSRLSFLRFDEKEIVWERNNIKGIEIQIDNHHNLKLNKTYRIEATDEPGGPLIAELFTVRRLSNDKALCMLRPYNYHRISNGYLFIKDGDEPQFITNISILPESKIEKISILRKGGNWVNSNHIYPGETIEIRLEGKSLSRAEFIFQGLEDVSADTVIRNESIVHYIVKVPINIRQKSVQIYNRDRKTGVNLDVQEFLRPRELDFITLDYGGKPFVVNEISQPLLHRGTIGDVNIHFNGKYIDEEDYIYGKQYLEVEVRIKDNQNIVIERHIIDDIEVCPSENSPRYFSYGGKSNCMNEAISVNDYLSNKTHGLENWSKIELIIRHRKGTYDGRGYSQRIEIIKEKLVTFDVDLSIPAGLLIKKVGVDGFPGLSGVSLSMLGQFSFYQKGEIQRLRPYKIGAGFLAQNAFNFNPEADRDLGIVILGSVYPTRKERKFSFPLYAGFGYFLNEGRFFYLIGPGIRINF